MSFATRSTTKELLDQENIPFEEIKRNMQELEYINRNLGGHKITLEGTTKLIHLYHGKAPIHICEIGCGGGDNLKFLYEYFSAFSIPVKFTGIDINPSCTRYAREATKHIPVNYITSDYKYVEFEEPVNIIFSSLFCHHLSDSELVSMFQWCNKNASIGFFVNDLHRHPLAYHFIKTATQLFSKSRLVKNDAPLSVKRGFKKKELKELLEQAGIHNAEISWKWAYRWLVVVNTKQSTSVYG